VVAQPSITPAPDSDGHSAARNFFPLLYVECNNDPLCKSDVNGVVQVGQSMWIEKLAGGVLQVDTPIGPRYVRPNFKQRAYLLWIFRNFPSLPQQVLRPRERQLIDRLWSENKFVSMPAMGAPHQPVIGRIERRMQAQPEVQPIRKPMSSSSAAVQEQGREAASA
jgi:hypothetical protein